MKLKHTLSLVFILIAWLFFGTQKEEPLPTPSGAKQALDFWSDSRAYPQSIIPDVGFMKAYEFTKKNLFNINRSLKKSSSSHEWRSIGPNNIGGRTLAIAIDPVQTDIIYAGSASGGLWKSTTAGRGASAWQYVSTGFPVLGVGSIAIDTSDPKKIYIGTGEVYGYQQAFPGINYRTTRGSYGIGILKTTDGGKTWTKSLDWSYNQKRGVQAVRIDPQNPNIIWAATTEGTYKSTDSGTTWLKVHSVIMAMDIAINPDDPNTVFVACGGLQSAGHGIYRTKNGGSTWSKLVIGLPNTFGGKAQLAISKSSPNIIWASIGNGYWRNAGTWLCKSTNNGDSWSTISTPDYASAQGWYSHYVGVHPTNPNIVIAAGQLGIYKSTSGGTNLQMKTEFVYPRGTPPPGGPEGPPTYAHADNHAMVFHPANPDIIYFANDGGVWRSLDGGETFQSCNGGYQTTQFYNGFSTSQTDSLLSIGGFQDNWTAVYEGSSSWRRVAAGDGSWTAIHPGNPNTIYASSQNLAIVKSNNRMESWFNVRPPESDSEITAFIAPFVLSPSNPNTLYAGRSNIYKSTNGGSGWTITTTASTLQGNPAIAMAISTNTPDTVYVATAPQSTKPGIFITTNGASSWQNITGNLPNRYPLDIAVNPQNAAQVYVVFGGFGSSHIFKSNNAGQSWIDIGTGLPDVPTSAVVVDPEYPRHIYLGNDLGVFVSLDDGGSWQDFREGLPDAVITMDLSISPTNRKLRVATHGNGAYERSLLNVGVDVEDSPSVVLQFKLKQNYPNPFNPTTTIEFEIPDRAHIIAIIYDLSGRIVDQLVDGMVEPGSHKVVWNASGFSAGVYFFRLEVKESGFKQTRLVVGTTKLTLLK